MKVQNITESKGQSVTTGLFTCKHTPTGEQSTSADTLIEYLKAIDRLTCNCPLMSREVQKAFERQPEMDAYRCEVNELILSIRHVARTALNP